KFTTQSGFFSPQILLGVLCLVGAALAFPGAIALATPFADPAETADGPVSKEVPATVETVALPQIALDQSMTNFVAAVTTSAIDAKNKLVGFQGDFTFDERVVTFQNPPVQRAGITGGNWNVSGNVLPGTG